MADQADLASAIEEREREWALARHRSRHPLPPTEPIDPGLCAVCTCCTGPTIAGADTCSDCASLAVEGGR